MKKLILILSFLFSFVCSFGQPISNRSNPSLTVSDSRLQAALNFLAPRYTDTISANVSKGIDSCGAIIYLYSTNSFWYRACSPKRWEPFGSSSQCASQLNIINDTTLQICECSVCVDFHVATDITNISYAYFLNDSTIVLCNPTECDTVNIPRQNIYAFQNGLTQISAGITEWGGLIVHPTTIDMNGYNVTYQQGLTGGFLINQNNAAHSASIALLEPGSISTRLESNGILRTGNTNFQIQGFNANVSLVSDFNTGDITLPGYDPATRNDGTGFSFLSPGAGGHIYLKTLPNFSQCGGLLNPGLVTWDSLLVFDVSPSQYCINNVSYSAGQSTVTLAAADPTNPRYDAIIVDTFGLVSVITGDAAVSPIAPQVDPLSQLLLTYILVNAQDVVFSGITQEVIYDEGVEWDTLANGLTTNFRDITNPVHLIYDANVGAITNNDYIQFTKGSTVDLNNYTVLKLYIRLKSTFAAGNRIGFTWMNNNTIVSTNTVQVGGNNSLYNFVRTTVGAYMVLSIPVNAWVLNSTTVNRLRIRFTGTNAQGVFVDWVQLQGGIQQGQGGPTGLQSFAETGNIVFTPTVINPTGPNTTVTNTLANAAANTFLGNQTSGSAQPTYSPIDLSQNANFDNTLSIINLSPGAEGSFMQTISGLPTWTVLPTGYDTTFVTNGLTVIPGINNDTLLWGGTLREATTIVLAGHRVEFKDAVNDVPWVIIDQGTFQIDLFSTNEDGSASSSQNLLSDPATDVIFGLSSQYGGQSIVLRGDGKVGSLTIQASDSVYLETTLAGAASGYVWTLKDENSGSGYWAAAGGGGGNTIYTGDGTLAGDRIVTMDGHFLFFDDGPNQYLHLNPANSEFNIGLGDGSTYAAFDISGTPSGTVRTRWEISDAIGAGEFVLNTNVGDGYFFDLNVGDGSNTIGIFGDAIAQTITLTAANGMIVPHIVGGGNNPTIAAGAGAGTSPTVTVTGTDEAGYIEITSGTLPSAAATIATVTFDAPYASAPRTVLLTPANSATALLTGVTMVYVPQSTISTTTFDLFAGTSGLTGVTSYKFFYTVIQ